MNIDEYATRFRLQHPKIPEQYYGKLAKMENINKNGETGWKDTIKDVRTEKLKLKKIDSDCPLFWMLKSALLFLFF